MSIKVFISSNQKEFRVERKRIKEDLENDPSFSDYFEFFVFEEGPAQAISPEELYIDEVMNSEIYIGLLGSVYGDIKDNGLSATENEYNIFSSSKHEAYFFIKNNCQREEKVEEFIAKIQDNKVFKFFDDYDELILKIKESLKNYLIKQGSSKIPFDKKFVLDSSCDDVDPVAFDLLFDALEDENIMKLRNNRSPDNILATLKVGKKDINGKFYLNNTGILFFAKDISKFNIEHEVKMVRFNGNSKLEIIDKFYSKSPLFILLQEFENFFKKNTKMGAIIKDWKRIAIPEYPIEAVREAMINAIAHRDYNLKSFISFFIYDDRIEIISPGKLEYPLTLNDLENIEFTVHRNSKICDLFYKTVYMETIGSGITRMKNAMLNSGLPAPEFYEGSNYFKVVLRGPDGKLIPKIENIEDKYIEDLSYLNNRQMSAFTLMTMEGVKFYYSSYANKFGVSQATAKRDLKELLDLGLIKQTSVKRKNCFFV